MQNKNETNNQKKIKKVKKKLKKTLHQKRHQRKRAKLLKKRSSGRVTRKFLKRLYATKRCFYCHEEIPEEKRTMDHVRPLSKGGWHDPDNLVMACVRCNSRKSNKDLKEFIEEVRK